MRQLNLLGITADGINVYDRPYSHLTEHVDVTPELLKEALAKITQVTDNEKHIVDMGRKIGMTTCVPVTDEDDIVYVIRKNRKGPTPMVRGRKGIDCNNMVVILKRAVDDEGEYFILITAYIGEGAEPEPWDRRFEVDKTGYDEAVEFWNTHALVYDPEVVELRLSA